MTQSYHLNHSLSQRLLKYIFDNVFLEHVGHIHVSLLLSTCFFWAEQVEGVILSTFYSLGFIIRDLLLAFKLWVGWVWPKIF